MKQKAVVCIQRILTTIDAILTCLRALCHLLSPPVLHQGKTILPPRGVVQYCFHTCQHRGSRDCIKGASTQGIQQSVLALWTGLTCLHVDLGKFAFLTTQHANSPQILRNAKTFKHLRQELLQVQTSREIKAEAINTQVWQGKCGAVPGLHCYTWESATSVLAPPLEHVGVSPICLYSLKVPTLVSPHINPLTFLLLIWQLAHLLGTLRWTSFCRLLRL